MAYPEHAVAERMTKWDHAATIAASLAHLLVYQQDAVGLTLFDERLRFQLPVSSNRASLPEFARAIESHAPKDKTNLKVLFRELAGRIPRRGMVVLISDLLTGVDDIVDGLRRLRYGRHDVLVLHVLDHDEITFPFADRTLFEGIEAPQQILTDPQSLRRSYLTALETFLGRIRRACLDHNIDYALLNTADKVEVALATFLATRMHRRKTRV
jgi:uncharacterized protein (DUF58 family)